MVRFRVEKLAGLVVVLMLLPALTLSLPLHSSPPPVSAQAATLSSSGWEIVPPPSSATMYALDMLNANDGWSGGIGGFIYHYDGISWQGVGTSFSKAVRAIDMVSPSSGWGVTATGQIIVYNGFSWEEHSKPAEGLSDIYMMSALDGWAVGAAEILRFDAPSNSWLEFLASPVWLKGIDMVNANDGWIVGFHGTFLHWDGSSWTRWGTPIVGILVTDVDMVSSTDGWAVGGAGVIYHYNGSGWSEVSSPTTNDLNAVSMLSADDGWAVGEDGVLLHYDGSSWQIMTSPTSYDLHAVQILSTDDGWAMGNRGTILHFTGLPGDLSASTKTVNTRQAAVGEHLTYTINLENIGPNPAPSVVMTDTTPAGTTYVADSESTTKGTVTSTDPLVVEVGDVMAGEQVTISFQVLVEDLGLTCWFVTNQAIIDMEGTQWTRQAFTSVGDCWHVFLPLVSQAP